MKNRIVIGTRGSRLALKQTEIVAEALVKVFPEISPEICVISTQGDRDLKISLSGRLTKGLFTEEIERELLSGKIDIAVHSLKDLPTQSTPGIVIGAYLQRAMVEDVWIGHIPLDELPPNSVVGTSSPRREAQLLRMYPHLLIKEIRGNVETRIEKVKRGEYAGILMARAGMIRLGMEDQITQVLPTSVIVPAPGQAAIAVHRREDDDQIASLLDTINHIPTQKEVLTERYILSSMGGGCAIPLGCCCSYDEKENDYTVEAFYQRQKHGHSIYLKHTFPENEYQQGISHITGQLNEL
ncbi:MAG: hydroxymethylbilane synthase [Porphyromonas sp.]|nr:hydroxymethylbilane synthase [Porphyromonas sp.]